MFLKIKFYVHNFKMLHTFISPVHMDAIVYDDVYEK